MCQKKIMRKRSNEHLSDEPPKKRISPGGNILPSQITPGEIFTDLSGKQWRLGKAIGYGGFGEIYLASDNIKEPVRNDAKYVVKVESHSNGPLFVEINCLIRIAKLHMIEEWKAKHGNNQLGMPHYIASGSHILNNEKLRFLVIPRYEQDLEKIFLSKNKKFNLKTTILICIQILDVLEYIHSKGYVHCDVKASNILHCYPKAATQIIKTQNTNGNYSPLSPRAMKNLRQVRRVNYLSFCEFGVRWSELHKSLRKRRLRSIQRVNYEEDEESCFDAYTSYDSEIEAPDEEKVTIPKENNKNQVILIDYGLATKYLQSDGRHKQFCNDERKAHAGTIQFCSIDAHLGASSRRSDLESLGYNMIYWLTSSLPWENDVNNPETIQMKKEECLNNLKQFLSSCFGNDCPTFIYEYFNYIKSLTFESAPDYIYCKQLFSTALKEYGYKDDGILDFDHLEGWGQKPKKKKNIFENRMAKKTTKSHRLPLTSNIIVEKPKLRKKTRKTKNAKLNWSQIPDPEEILRKKHQELARLRERKLTESSDSSCNNGNSLHNIDIKSLNPTYAMLDVFYKSRDKNYNCNGIYKVGKSGDCVELEQREGYTHAMNLVLTKMNQRRLEEIEHETENIVPVRKRNTRILRSTIITQKSSIKKPKSATVITRPKSTRVLRGHGLRG